MKKLSLNKFLEQFPNEAETWANATDEVRDIARMAKEYYNDYEHKKLKPCDFRSMVTPSQWNTEGKKYINDVYNKMNLDTKKAFNIYLKECFNIDNCINEDEDSEIDEIVKDLSHIQVRLMQIGLKNNEFNEISGYIHSAKECLINTESYKNK